MNPPEPSGEPEQIVCLRCGTPNDPIESRCAKCRAPLDDFASTVPWEMGTARPAAYAPAANPRLKPVIFWGAWLLFGPPAIFGLWSVLSTLDSLIGRSGGELFNGAELAYFLFDAFWSAVAIWALWAVTARYFRRGRKDEETA